MKYKYKNIYMLSKRQKKKKRQTMCLPGYQTTDGLMVTHALGHIMYGYYECYTYSYMI